MAMNRLNRDQVLIRALDLADSAVLDTKDRPAGTIVASALTIGWLQECLDYFHKKFPFSADIKAQAITIAAGDTTITVPTDFVLDYMNGIVLNDANGNSRGADGRLHRRSLGRVLSTPIGTTGSQPTIYCVRGSTIEIRDKADKQYTGKLWYYALPALLGAVDVPQFPDDSVLTDYVWLKIQEYHKVAKPGTARAYADDIIKQLQNSGIGNEAEEDQIGIDPAFAREYPVDPSGWMGKSSL